MSFEQPNLEKSPVSPEKPEEKKEVKSEYTDLLLAKEGKSRELSIEETQDVFLGHLKDLMQRAVGEEKEQNSFTHEEVKEVLDKFVFSVLTFLDGNQSQRISPEKNKLFHYPGIKMTPDISKEDVDSSKEDGLNWLNRKDIAGNLHERWYA